MSHFRFNLRNLVGLAPGLLVMLASPIAYGQAIPNEGFKSEGLTSYIFSPMAIPVVLVLALIVQLVYWQHNRNSNRKAQVVSSPQSAQAAKRRYDREEMSKLLKASATSKSKPRALEDAIRLSQLTQPVLPERVEHRDLDGAYAPEMAGMEAVDVDVSVDLENEMVAEDEVVVEVIADAPSVETEPQSYEREDGLETEVVK